MPAAGSLPPLYARWMDAVLGGPVPDETGATCHDCAMVSDDPANEPGFSPAAKCCTFTPEVWNFLAGGVLLDDRPEQARGRASVQRRLDAGLEVTPLGLGQTPMVRILYHAAPLAFGSNQALLCPHYLPEGGGLCGIWQHREATCATFFCKHTRGAVGKEFWMRLFQLLRAAEEALAGWAVLELDLEPAAVGALYPDPRDRDGRLTAHDLDRKPDPERLRTAWGPWRGREAEFYRECARLVASLAWDDVLRIGGARLAIHSRLVVHAHERWSSDAVPVRPATALVRITPRAPGRVRLATYSASDAIEVPAAVATALPYFDGRPTAEALAEIRRRENVAITPSLVRKLADFGVLRDAPRHPGSR